MRFGFREIENIAWIYTNNNSFWKSIHIHIREFGVESVSIGEELHDDAMVRVFCVKRWLYVHI